MEVLFKKKNIFQISHNVFNTIAQNVSENRKEKAEEIRKSKTFFQIPQETELKCINQSENSIQREQPMSCEERRDQEKTTNQTSLLAVTRGSNVRFMGNEFL